jgi:hypothetical protein
MSGYSRCQPAGAKANPGEGQIILPAGVWAAELASTSGVEKSWLWQGFLAPGYVTLLTSQWKSGKTTLLAVLLSKLNKGESLAGLPVARGKAVVVSEETPAKWKERGDRLDFGKGVCFFCRPFPGKPSHEQWLALLDRLAAMRAESGIDLAVIDTLTSFLPGRDENHAASMMEALMPLQRLTNSGMSVLGVHHPAKGTPLPGQAARGSGALSSFVDILVEMHWFARSSEQDRRRRLLAFSRFEETPRQLVMELNAQGTDYLAHGDFQDEEFTRGWKQLRAVLEDADRKLTRREILADWPADFDPVNQVSLWRWLEQAVSRGLVLSEGTGRKNSPFRYWLPGREKQLQQDPPPITDFEAWSKWFLEREADGSS